MKTDFKIQQMTTTQNATKVDLSPVSENSGALVRLRQKPSSITVYQGTKNGLGFSAPIINDSGVWYEWLD